MNDKITHVIEDSRNLQLHLGNQGNKEKNSLIISYVNSFFPATEQLPASDRKHGFHHLLATSPWGHYHRHSKDPKKDLDFTRLGHVPMR